MSSMIDVLRRLNRRALNNWITDGDDFSADTRDATPEQVWRSTARGDRLLYLIDALVDERVLDRQWLSLATVSAAETVLKYIPASEIRPRRALNVARSFARGDASEAEVVVAADYAHACYVSFVNSPERDRFVAQAEAAYAAHVAGRIAQDPPRHRDWTAAVAVYVANAYAHAKLGGGASPDDTTRAFEESHARVARAVRRAVPWLTVSAAIDRLEARDRR